MSIPSARNDHPIAAERNAEEVAISPAGTSRPIVPTVIGLLVSITKLKGIEFSVLEVEMQFDRATGQFAQV